MIFLSFLISFDVAFLEHVGTTSVCMFVIEFLTGHLVNPLLKIVDLFLGYFCRLDLRSAC